MTEETAMIIPDDVRATLMEFDNDYLAGTFRLWDCNLKDWYDPLAVVFRFEKDDVLIWNENGVLRYKQGAVNLDEAENVLPSSFRVGITEDECLCWAHDDLRRCFVGMTSIYRELINSFA